MANKDEIPPKINQWDGQTVKNTLDDEIRKVLNDISGWKEIHSLMNGRLMISFIGVCFSAVAIIYDYYHPFPESRIVLAICCVFYFILMGILYLYQWHVERNTFYEAHEVVTGRKKRQWKWNSDLLEYDDKYTISAEYYADGRSGKGSVTKSIANFFDEDGQVVRPRIKSEVVDLYKKLVSKDE